MRTDLVLPIGDLVRRRATLAPDAPLWLQDGGPGAGTRTVDGATYDRTTDELAAGLLALGVAAPGQRIATYLGNSVTLLEAYTAIAKAGCTTVFCNAQLTARELGYLLADSDARLVLTDADHVEVAQAVAGDRPVVVVEDRWAALQASGAGATAGDLPRVDLDDEVWVGYTSGTTGLPKGASLTHRNATWVAATVAELAGYRAEDAVLCCLPLFHSYALNSCYLQVIGSGARQIVLDRFSVPAVLDAIERHRITVLPAVPTMLTFLAYAAERATADTTSLRTVVSAGAVLKTQVITDFEQAYGVPILDGWGSTETGSFATFTPAGSSRVPGSCGLPLPGCAVRVVDPATGVDVAPGERGELVVRGPNVMREYLNKPDQTATALEGGWYRSGDVAELDPNGYLYIVDRLKDLIISGGYNIAPKEIEDVILAHPAVLDVAVVGIVDDARGEVPKAFVVCKDGSTLDTDELLAHCRVGLAHYKLPRLIVFTNALPKTASGKVQRYLLRG